MHLSAMTATKPLQMLQISPIRQFHLPSNLYPYLEIFFVHALKPTLLPFFPHDPLLCRVPFSKILTQLSTWEYTTTLERGFAGEGGYRKFHSFLTYGLLDEMYGCWTKRTASGETFG